MLCFAAGGVMAVGGWWLADRYSSTTAHWCGTVADGCCASAGCGTLHCPEQPATPPSPGPECEPVGCLQLTAAAPIVIRDEEAPAEPVPCPDNTDATHPMNLPDVNAAVAAAPPVDEPASVCPMIMPYCTDDVDAHCVVPRMPQADESVPLMCGCRQGTAESCDLPEHLDRPACQEDAHYHDQYPGMPYAGPAPKPASHAKQKPAAVPGQEECPVPDPAAPRLHKAHYPGKRFDCEECPAHPEVDTMEYRKSDGGLNEYGPGQL
jgi:hypothetical protein